MPSTGDPLARRYRRLLLGYPPEWRRARGDEMVAVLLEAAPPGRTRPAPREAVDLIRHGLRSRLGRPASYTVVAWAVLTALICGLFTAALASWAAWQTARPLPDPGASTALFAEVLPGYGFTDVEPAAALFTFYSQPLRPANAKELLLGDGGEYQQSGVAGALTAPAGAPPQETLALAQRRLTETGWRVYPPHVTNAVDCADPRCDPSTLPTDTTLLASRGDTILTLWLPSNQATGSVGLLRATPPAVLPAAVAAGLLGAAAGWLVFGWASRRTERPHPAARPVTVLHGITLVLWWAPVVLATPQLIEHQLGEPHPSWHPMWEWLGQPALSLFFVVGAGCALAGLALAGLPRRDPGPQHTTALG
ncbi:hypothetical protein [Micromonospora sp. WMMD812]|uniref:hypothetical protein n=1 Tax=Micromonospora sp. WMMD812 TaxID=3015152 RepID=UPI00248D32F8|nr:hypothetical protein [Micromonospora sp. WMMD812]WBB65669.1 hypothetical protein O7603_21010 [Micromonospora sp. WMMD812]